MLRVIIHKLQYDAVCIFSLVLLVKVQDNIYDYHGHSMKGKEKIVCKWLIQKGEMIRMAVWHLSRKNINLTGFKG